jgi:hypothetical protein
MTGRVLTVCWRAEVDRAAILYGGTSNNFADLEFCALPALPRKREKRFLLDSNRELWHAHATVESRSRVPPLSHQSRLVFCEYKQH